MSIVKPFKIKIMANSSVKVVIPTNKEEKLSLANKIYEKHKTDAVKSPLNAMQDVKWESAGPQISVAQGYHDTAEEYIKKAEEFYKKRDLEMVDVEKAIRASRDILLGAFSKNPKQMGAWGFVVNDVVKKAAKKKP